MIKIKFLFLLLLITHTTIGQKKETLNSNQIKNLETLTRIWGFLKYYHPQVADGKYNWDEQFITMLPKVQNVQTKEELSTVLQNWLNELGEVPVCKSCKNTTDKTYSDKNFDLSWLKDSSRFTPALIEKLKYIEENRHNGEQYYIKTFRIGHVELNNESIYQDTRYPSQEYRLLSLARYWNVIEYFYPYKYLTDQKWDNALTEMLPVFYTATDAYSYELAITKTVQKLNDSHGFYSKATFLGNAFIPAKFKIIDNKAVVTAIFNDSLAKLNDIRVGDLILQIDNKTIEQVIADKLQYMSGSNENGKLKELQYYLANGNNTITFERKGQILSHQIKSYPSKIIFGKPVKKPIQKILENNIGYIDMTDLEIDDIDKVMEALSKTKGIIIDMRTYPKSIPYELAGYFRQRDTLFNKTTIPDLTYPGKFFYEDRVFNPMKAPYYNEKVVVLVNEWTQSRAEYSTMILQTGDNVITMGSQTAGADGNTSRFYFIGGYSTMFSGTGVYYPDGTQTQRIGIRVDIEAKPTLEGLKSGRDEVLEKAIEYLK